MREDRETQSESTESTERIPPGSMPPDDEDERPDDGGHEPATDEDEADEESKQSFPASDPPAW